MKPFGIMILVVCVGVMAGGQLWAAVIANYQADYLAGTSNGQTRPERFNDGWDYMWNSGGAIGFSTNYTSLKAYDAQYNYDGSGGVPRAEPASYVHLYSTGGHPGSHAGYPSDNPYDRYAIAAYTVQSGEAGPIYLYGNISVGESQSNGVELRVYVNDTIQLTQVQNGGTSGFFWASLGSLNVNDKVYVAFGPNGSRGFDSFTFNFTLAHSDSGDRWWDSDGISPANGGSGTWNTTSSYWANAPSSGVYGTWNNTANMTAHFTGAGGTVTLGEAITAQALGFYTNGYTISGSSTLTLTNGGGGSLGAATIYVANPSDTATISAPIAGSAGLVKSGPGKLVLSGPLNYTGGTTVNAGTLVLAKSDVPFPSAGSTGQFGSAHTVTINTGGTLQLDASWITGDGLQNKAVVSGGTLYFNNGDNYWGNIELTGGQITTRTSGNPWRTGNWGSGLIKVNPSAVSSTISGRLCFVGTTSAPVTTFDVADGAAADDLVVSATIYDHGGFEGKMALVKAGAGRMVLSGPLNYTGGTTVNGGTLVLAMPDLGWTTNGQFGSSGHVITVNAGATLQLTQRGLLGYGQAHQLIINGGTVEFQNQTYQSRIEMTGGRIVSTASNYWRVGNWGNGQITVKASSTSSTIEQYMMLVKTASATKTTFDVEDGPAAQDLIVSANIIDHGDGYEGMELVKAGAGTMVLSGTNTYIGPTTIQAGKLLLMGTHTPATTPGLYTVAAGGTLGGTGRTNAPVQVQGTIAPGASVGTIYTGSETWASGGTYQWEIQDVDAGPGTGWDLVNITGTLSITATAAQPFVIDVVSLGGGGGSGLVADFNPLGVYSWEIARTTDGVVDFAAEKFLVDLGDFQNYWHGGRWWVSQQGNSVFLNYAIPEPSSGLLALVALAGLGLWRWITRK